MRCALIDEKFIGIAVFHRRHRPGIVASSFQRVTLRTGIFREAEGRALVDMTLALGELRLEEFDPTGHT